MHETIAFPARAARPVWPLVVVAARDVTPRMRRVSLVGEALERFSWRPGQDLVFSLPQSGGGVARRHYTIRAFDPHELRLEVDVVLHGASPGARWAASAKIGDPVTAEGPRGRTVVNGRADWHLFTGDETALPAIAAMIEALPAGASAHAIIEVEAPDEEQVGEIPQDGEHALRHLRIALHAGPDEDGLRAQPVGLGDRQGGADAKGSRLIGACSDHAAPLATPRVCAHHDRLPPIRRVVKLLHRRVEGIHVEVNDAAVRGHNQ